MDKFDDLLKDGRDRLIKFRSDNSSGNTGIEDDLIQPYLDQMIEMNDNILTMSSTNSPGALPFFQGFFVEGYCKLSVARKLREMLDKKYIWVVYYDVLSREYIDYSDKLNTWDISRTDSPFKYEKFGDSSVKSLRDLTVENKYDEVCISEDMRKLEYPEEIMQYVDDNGIFEEIDPVVHVFMTDSCRCKKTLYSNINGALNGETKYFGKKKRTSKKKKRSRRRSNKFIEIL